MVETQKNRLEAVFVWLLALFNTLFTGAFCFLHQRSEMHDELSLFNPIYMFLHYGKMTFPANGFYESMVSHPPTHYLEIAFLMKLGLNLFYAATMPVFLLTLLVILLIIKSPFQNLIKAGLLIGMMVPVTHGYFLVNLEALRPDYALALAWLGGLIALESARLEKWNSKKLFIGSLLLGFASILHYYALPAFASTLVYIVWAWGTLGHDTAKSKIAWLTAGFSVFLIPFLIFFFLPNINDILFWVNINQNKWGEGGLIQAILQHRSEYRELSNSFTLVKPFYWLSLSVVIGAVLFLSFLRETKGLALACLPMPLFIYLYSRGKSAGYFIPEMMIFYSSVWLVGLVALKRLTRKFSSRAWNYLFGSMILICIYSSITRNYVSFSQEMSFEKKHYEMHTARACAKEIVGRDALIAGRENVWYIGGGDYYCDVTGELVYVDSLTNINVSDYFSHFDAVVEHNAGANLTFTRELETISSWYADSTLHLKGFYLTNNNLDISDLAMIMLSKEHPDSVLGFGCMDNERLFKFQQEERGNYVFAVYICPNDTTYKMLHEYANFLNIIPLPDPKGPINQMGWQAKDNLVLTTLPYNDYLAQKHRLPSSFRLREEVRCKMREINKKKLLKKLIATDHTIRFYNGLVAVPAELLRH